MKLNDIFDVQRETLKSLTSVLQQHIESITDGLQQQSAMIMNSLKMDPKRREIQIEDISRETLKHIDLAKLKPKRHRTEFMVDRKAASKVNGSSLCICTCFSDHVI